MEKEFDLDGIVPWGRTFDEYCAFFALDERDLSNRSPVLDVAAGPSSFVAEANARKIRATAIDPIYGASGPDIRRRFEQVFPAMVSGLGRASYRFQWGYYDSPDAVLAHRRTALERFMADYDCGRQEGRYLVGGLPGLPIETDACGIALCSHLLFLTARNWTKLSIAAIAELLRIAREVRIFPLVAMDGRRSPYVGRVLDYLSNAGFGQDLIRVPFEFQKGANEMLRAWRLP